MGTLNCYLWTALAADLDLSLRRRSTEYRQTASSSYRQPSPGQGRAGKSMPVHNFFSWARIFTNSTEPSSLHINTGRFTDPTAIFPITPSSFPSTLLLCLFSSYTVPTVNSSPAATCFRVGSTSDPAVPLLLHTINRVKSHVGRISLSTTSLPQSLSCDHQAVRVGPGKET
jgi:hypothetical protein